jgi:DNA-directed RNA polymerase subunit omega
MSRLSSELAVERIGNRYDLILVASRRARELSRGDLPRVSGESTGYISTALREIEAGVVDRKYLYKPQDFYKQSHHRNYS